jgi:hypothetical protein
MKKVFSSKDLLMIGHLKNVLAAYGIHCITKKVDLISAAGEIPPTECWPELWVIDDDKALTAKAVLKKTMAPLASVKKPWRCSGCSEEIEGQFTECWKCGRSREFRKTRSAKVIPISSASRKK